MIRVLLEVWSSICGLDLLIEIFDLVFHFHGLVGKLVLILFEHSDAALNTSFISGIDGVVEWMIALKTLHLIPVFADFPLI